MSGENIVETLLNDGDPVDPKDFVASQIPSAVEVAKEEAMHEFKLRCSTGRIASARDADEQASDIAQQACDRHNLDEDDFDEVVSDLFLKASELFPGEW